MKKITVCLLLVCLTIGCKNQSNNQDKSAIETTEKEFKLEKDIFSFSKKMNQSDTLVVFANLSACLSKRYEKNILIKTNNELFLTTYVEGDYIDTIEKELETVKYKLQETDSLSFESFFRHLESKHARNKPEYSTRPSLKIIYKQDSIEYFSDGLNDHLANIRYYILIKMRLYPNAKVYQPVKLIPKPRKRNP